MATQPTISVQKVHADFVDSSDERNISSNNSTPADDAVPGSEVTSVSFSCIPRFGETYMIRHRDTGKYMTLRNGRLGIEDAAEPAIGRHWVCEEESGWYALRHAMAGTYLGWAFERNGYRIRNNGHELKLFAREGNLLPNMSLIFRPTPCGTWHIWMLCGSRSTSLDIVAADDNDILIAYDSMTLDDQTEWEFIKV